MATDFLDSAAWTTAPNGITLRFSLSVLPFKTANSKQNGVSREQSSSWQSVISSILLLSWADGRCFKYACISPKNMKFWYVSAGMCLITLTVQQNQLNSVFIQTVLKSDCLLKEHNSYKRSGTVSSQPGRRCWEHIEKLSSAEACQFNNSAHCSYCTVGSLTQQKELLFFFSVSS